MIKEVDYAQIGSRIKELRKSQGITQNQLAEIVDVNPSHISNMENAYTKVSLGVLIAVANALDTSLDYLLYDCYQNVSHVIENEILINIKESDEDTKKKILGIIKVLNDKL